MDTTAARSRRDSRGKVWLIAFFCALLCGFSQIASANISVSAEASKDEVMLGEQFDLLVTVLHDDGYTLSEPNIGQTIGDFTVVKSERTASAEGRPKVEYRYTLAGFKLDRATIASIAIEYADPANQPGKLTTKPIGISVVGTVKEGETEIKDIKDMVPIEPRMALWLKILIAVASIAIVVLVVMWRIRRRRVRLEEAPEAKPIPPSVQALAELEKLLKGNLLFEKRYKEFYFELSDIVRRFLTRRLGLWAVDMTTTEIEFAMRSNPISEEFTEATLETLRFSDMVKFAKLIPPDDKTDEVVDGVRELIELGREPLFGMEAERAVNGPLQGKKDEAT
ncbi:MAG: hypothetical protein JW941_10060 [Candidatus Coatesbacteria bacterium]|nr:hypothetical protein [Candidatus Coatesbacteria bacterium]